MESLLYAVWLLAEVGLNIFFAKKYGEEPQPGEELVCWMAFGFFAIVVVWLAFTLIPFAWSLWVK